MTGPRVVAIGEDVGQYCARRAWRSSPHPPRPSPWLSIWM